MEKKTVKKLVLDLEKELLRLGYTEGSMAFYKRRWKMLLEFAEKQGETYYSERLGINFVDKYFNILEKDFEGSLIQSEVQNLRVIRMRVIFKFTELFYGGITSIKRYSIIHTSLRSLRTLKNIVLIKITPL